MKLLYTNIDRYFFNGVLSNITVETDGELLYVTVGPDGHRTSPNGSMEMYVIYNGREADISSSPYSERCARFTYANDVRELSLLLGNGLQYRFSWAGDLYDPTPKASVNVYGFRHMDSYKITYDCDSIDGYEICLVGIKTYIWSEDRQEWYNGSVSIDRDTSGIYTEELDSGDDYWDKCQLELYFAAYKNGESDYRGIYKHTTPLYTVVSYSSPYAPHSLNYGDIRAGGSGEISWSRPYDSKHKVVSYELQRSVDGGEFESIYRGRDNYYTDTLGEDAVSVVYRVGALVDTSVRDWCVGERKGVAVCNAYVGIGGEIRPAVAVYICVDGVPGLTSSIFETA